MLEAALFAGIASLGLVVGFLIATRRAPLAPTVGMAMAFGAGILMAVVAYALVLDTIETSERPAVVAAGIAAGALVYYFGDRMIASRLGEGGGLGLALGAVLDGVPESLVIGISVALFGEASIPLVIGAFIANTAESVGATPELIEGGFSAARTRLLWLAIVGASVLSAMIGYQLLSNISRHNGAIFNGFAGGAVLMVLADALIPEGYEKAGRVAGLLVVVGFAVGFALEHLH
jgi:ZIP family zinc transporter